MCYQINTAEDQHDGGYVTPSEDAQAESHRESAGNDGLYIVVHGDDGGRQDALSRGTTQEREERATHDDEGRLEAGRGRKLGPTNFEQRRESEGQY